MDIQLDIHPLPSLVDQTYSLNLPSFSGGYVYKDASNMLLCNDCGISLSRLEFAGSIVVDLQSAQIQSSTITVSQDMVQRFNMELKTSGATSGSWSYVMSTLSMQAITVCGVFTIS
jgi:hypothetical protein